MAQFTLKGKIIAELPEKSGTGKNGKEWKSKEYVVTEPGQYVKNVCFQVLNGNIDNFGLSTGQEVELQCEIDARQWQEKWFNSITCWKATILGVQEPQYSSPPTKDQHVDDKDDLPF